MVNLLIYFAAGLFLLPAADFSSMSSFGAYEWLMIFALVANTLIAYGSFAEALNRIPAGHLSLIITVNPIGTILVIQVSNYFDLPWVPTEPVTLAAMLGAALVVIGVALAVSRKKK